MSNLLVEELRKAYVSLEKVKRIYADDSFKVRVCADVLQEKINRVDAALMEGVNGLTPKEIELYRLMISFAITPIDACRYLLLAEKPNMTLVHNIYEFYELNKYEHYDYWEDSKRVTTDLM